jgi:hypothetical protein
LMPGRTQLIDDVDGRQLAGRLQCCSHRTQVTVSASY